MKERITKEFKEKWGFIIFGEGFRNYDPNEEFFNDIDILIEQVIAERMPTLEEAQNTAYNRCMGLQVNSHGEASPEPDRFTYMIFIEGTEWFRSRMEEKEK